MAKEQRDWLTSEEAALIISANSGRQISAGYVRAAARAGRILVWKVRKHVYLYRRTDVELIRVKQRSPLSIPVMPEKDELKTIKVYGDEHFKEYAKTHPVPPAYERRIHAEQITFTCEHCHQQITEVRFPGPVRYCSACAVLVKREKSRLRTQRSRQKAKERRTL